MQKTAKSSWEGVGFFLSCGLLSERRTEMNASALPAETIIRSARNRLPAQMVRIMRMIVFFLLVGLLSAQAEGTAQKISFSGKNIRLKQVFAAIKKQTGYAVLYNEQLLSGTKPVTVYANDLPLAEFLNQILKDQRVEYAIEGKTIVLSGALPVNENAKAPVAVVSPQLLAPKPITGKITDSLGRPIQGVSIQLLPGNKGAYSGRDGMFKIDNVSPGDYTVEVSFVGYLTQTRKITVLDNIPLILGDFILKINPAAMEEVTVAVNTGYQQIRPEQSTGAVSRIGTKEFESQISTDFLSGLNGKVTGLMLNTDIQFSSNVGGVRSNNSLFNIRGISTMTGNQSPLIVIDGFPTELSLDMIDPNEIKSVTILKDAAAATVYGVRASNGVIIIERKKAAEGKAVVNFRATAGFTPEENYSRYRWAKDGSRINVLYDLDVLSTSIDDKTWGQLRAPNSSNSNVQSQVFYILAQREASVITPYQADKALNALMQQSNLSEYNRLFLRTAATQTYHIDVSGGNKNALYYLTANYTNNTAEQVKNNSRRIVLSGRTNLQLSERLSAELTTDYQENRSFAAPVPGIGSLSPYEHVQDENGKPLSIGSGSTINPFLNKWLMEEGLEDYLYYPLVDMNEVNDRNQGTNNRTTLNLNYKIASGIGLTLGGIYENANTNMRHYASGRSSEARQYIDSYVSEEAGELVFNVPKGGFLRSQQVKTSSYTVRAQLNYDKKIAGDHSINGILGAEIRNVTEEGNGAAYFGYNDETLLQQPINYESIAKNEIYGSFINRRFIDYSSLFNQLYNENRFVSGYSNIVYAYKNRYSASGSIRIDQSNLFGTDPKYRYKPLWSVGAAWNLGNEHFLDNAGWIRQLKLRAAYGFNGNVAKLSLPQVIAQSYVNSYTSPFSEGLRMYSYANSSLRWEQTKNTNIGLDYSIFKNIQGSIDFYKKNSTDLMADAQIDPTIGTVPAKINSASIVNKGIEISLHADWISNDKLNWNTGFITSYNTSKVLKLYQDLGFLPATLNTAGFVEGQPVGALYAYRWGGLDENGMPQVRDETGNKYTAIDYNTISPSIYYNGTTIPTVNIGLSNRLDVGNFYFYCMIGYYGGFKVQVPRADPSANRPLKGAGDYWKQPGDELHTDVMALAGYEDYFSSMVYDNADTYVVKGNYITVRDITASYNFSDAAFFKRAGIKHFEVKLQASNVWTAGMNKYNYSVATGSYQKPYITPTYSIALFTNF